MPTPEDSPSPAAGFTLIEVIVALVILAISLMAFYEFLSSSLHAADRVRRAAAAYDRAENALALARALNPMESPDGTLDLGGYRIHWRAEPVGAARVSTAYPSGKGRFIVALYRLVFDFPDDRDFAPVEVTKLGYHLEGSPGNAPEDAAN
jgi:prepilin-type N-terminal cleavage/methylation domain-containing protein